MRINYATLLTNLPRFCCLAAALLICGGEKATAEGVDPYQGFVQNSESGTRSRWVSNSTKGGESVSTRAGAPVERYAEDDTRRQSLWDAYNGSILGIKRNPYDAFETGSIQDAGAVECDCGADCKCPPLVCDAGHCKANFVAMFSATWCKPCRDMYPVLKELRKEGYIVYIYTLDTDEFEDLDLDVKFQIAAYPTFIFFDKGKETNRSIGKTTKDRITRYLVKEKDQPKPEPSPDPDVYDDL